MNRKWIIKTIQVHQNLKYIILSISYIKYLSKIHFFL